MSYPTDNISALMDKMNKAFDTKKYKQSLDISEKLLKIFDEEEYNDDDDIMNVSWIKVCSCFCIASEDNNQDLYTKAQDLCLNFGNNYGWSDSVIYIYMLIDDALGNNISVRHEAIVLMNSDDNDFRTEATALYHKYTDELLDECSFLDSISYDRRKYIYIGKNIQKISGTYQWNDNERVIDCIFTLDKIPSDIVFPLGHPQPGLYVAHPILTDRYYPIERYEETLFMEKVHEFCWLVQCLGATEVSFHSNKGLTVSECMGSSTNTNDAADIYAVNINGGYGKKQKKEQSNNANKQVELVQHFSPIKKFYCPDDLVWLDTDDKWQTLVKQRLQHGGLADYNYKISSSETCQISTIETQEVKANFKYIMCQVDVNYDSNNDLTLSNTEETVWSIHVDFAPME